jgi:DNA-binding PadR family transcriptional regulator
MDNERPRKVYRLTGEGQSLLNFTEDSLSLICRRISSPTDANLTVEPPNRATLKSVIREAG